jgi:hypothetical protein
MSKQISIYSTKKTPRMVYIFNLMLRDLLGLDPLFVSDAKQVENPSLPHICYDCSLDNQRFFVAADPLLFDRGIKELELNFGSYKGNPCFFPTFQKESVYPFDPFAASFYLVSRYEEYLPYLKDKYGRFNAPQSLAYQHNFLHKPLVNIWALDLASQLKAVFPDIDMELPEYKYQPTIDIDAAYAYRQKGFWRTVGGYAKNIRDSQWKEVSKRTQVLMGKENDPFDSFDYIFEFHRKRELKPIFFVLFADYGTNDKNLPVHNRKFHYLVRRLGDYGHVGIHPSFTSNSIRAKLDKEIQRLATVVHGEITKSRQHFLILSLPETYNRLLDLGIEEDYTMGFASQPGFRASIASPFYFYNLEFEMVTSLRIYPFMYMEGTYRDYLNTSPKEALESIKQLNDEVKNVGGTFISLWHNESLGGEKRWHGWREVYEEAVEYALE